MCVKDSSRPNRTGFYQLTLKGSKQAGLTGLKGGIVRKVAVDIKFSAALPYRKEIKILVIASI